MECSLVAVCRLLLLLLPLLLLMGPLIRVLQRAKKEEALAVSSSQCYSPLPKPPWMMKATPRQPWSPASPERFPSLFSGRPRLPTLRFHAKQRRKRWKCR